LVFGFAIVRSPVPHPSAAGAIPARPTACGRLRWGRPYDFDGAMRIARRPYCVARISVTVLE
jgi:hypothetical protein